MGYCGIQYIVRSYPRLYSVVYIQKHNLTGFTCKITLNPEPSLIEPRRQEKKATQILMRIPDQPGTPRSGCAGRPESHRAPQGLGFEVGGAMATPHGGLGF